MKTNHLTVFSALSLANEKRKKVLSLDEILENIKKRASFGYLQTKNCGVITEGVKQSLLDLGYKIKIYGNNSYIISWNPKKV